METVHNKYKHRTQGAQNNSYVYMDTNTRNIRVDERKNASRKRTGRNYTPIERLVSADPRYKLHVHNYSDCDLLFG